MTRKPNCRKCLKPKSLCKCGRPTVMTKDVLSKLEDAFMFCYTDAEACLYVGISPDTLYEYQKKNPKFAERKTILRLNPNLHAKKELVEGIKGSIDQARWWAKNKMRDEFGEKAIVELQGQVETTDKTSVGISDAVKAFNEHMRIVLIGKKPE